MNMLRQLHGLKRKLAKLFGVLRKPKACSHRFDTNELKLTGADEDSSRRVCWPCADCKKEFYANSGLQIAPKHGTIFRKA